MFDDLPETVLRKMGGTLADMSFDSITITRSTKAGGPKIIYVNDAFTDLTGYAAADVIGHTPGMLQGADTDHAVLSVSTRRSRAARPSTAPQSTIARMAARSTWNGRWPSSGPKKRRSIISPCSARRGRRADPPAGVMSPPQVLLS